MSTQQSLDQLQAQITSLQKQVDTLLRLLEQQQTYINIIREGVDI